MRYTKIAAAHPFSGAPKINIASVFGASPNKPVILRIPVTGQRPVTCSISGLPKGLVLNDNIITGKVSEEGDYPITLHAENALGKTEKKITLEIHPGNVLVTPLLGFTTWNAFGSEVTQEDVEGIAQKLVDLGIIEYSYGYVNLDSGWQSRYGGEFDAVMPNEKFPDMKQLTDKIHSLGLKAGTYSTPMLTAWGCPKEFDSVPGCTTGEPDLRFTLTNGGIGIERKERNNALQWNAWGFDYLKYDWRPTDPYNAELMRQELLKLDRDFGYCVTIRAIKEYAEYWSNCVSSYRSCPDTHREWPNLIKIYRSYLDFVDHIKKGHYLDLDLLDLGTCRCEAVRGTFTEDEQITAYSVRAFLSSPIQISSTLENIDEFELSLYCNEEIIAINQDGAFHTAVPIYQDERDDSILDVFEKELEDGCFAYALFNMGETKQTVLGRFAALSPIRDVWAKEDLSPSNYLDLELMPHTVRILKCGEKLETVANAISVVEKQAEPTVADTDA
ncbi:MAG: hypothetical protein IJC26_00255 [Clostridia bacterium]|nr:hypothetical protein [Clostridia bacterium]